jgi:hypothetical protein
MKGDGNGSGRVLAPFVWRPPRPSLERKRRLAELWLWATILARRRTWHGKNVDGHSDLCWESLQIVAHLTRSENHSALEASMKNEPRT